MRRLPILFVFLLVFVACGRSDSEPSPADAGVSEAMMLEDLSQRCAFGASVMCDILIQASDPGSELESFGNWCGGFSTSGAGFCADEFSVALDLGDLRVDCGNGDMAACDLLYIYSPFGSLGQAFGDECGGLGQGTSPSCVVSWGFVVDPG